MGPPLIPARRGIEDPHSRIFTAAPNRMCVQLKQHPLDAAHVGQLVPHLADLLPVKVT
jgi:hypothetical protein